MSQRFTISERSSFLIVQPRRPHRARRVENNFAVPWREGCRNLRGPKSFDTVSVMGRPHLWVLGIFVVAAIALSECDYFRWADRGNVGEHDRGEFYSDPAAGLKLQQGDPPVTVEKADDRILEIFKERFHSYRENLAALNDNMFYQLLFVVASIIVVRVRTDEFEEPILKQKVPLYWVHLVLPLCLGYLWLKFGFLLNEIIDDRIVLWKLADLVEGKPQGLAAVLKGGDLTAYWGRTVFTYSIRPTMADGAYIDGWFIAFRPDFNWATRSKSIVCFFLVCWGCFLGLGHGCMLGTIWNSARRFAKSRAACFWHAFYFWICVSILGISHYAFFYGGQQPNWLEGVMVGTGYLSLLVFVLILALNATHPDGRMRRARLSDGSGEKTVLIPTVNEFDSASGPIAEPRPGETKGI